MPKNTALPIPVLPILTLETSVCVAPSVPKSGGVSPERPQTHMGFAKPAQQISSLGSLEANILSMLWEIGRPASSMDVAEASLYKRRHAGQEPISFGSITTTLRRMAKKGLLQIKKGKLRVPLYFPTLKREQMAARILNNVSVTLLGRSLKSLLLRLANVTEPGGQVLSVEEQAGVERMMQAIEKAAVPDETLPAVDA